MKRPGSKRFDDAGRRAARGFSVVEVMVALIVFAIGGLTLAAVVPMGAQKSHAASRQSRASELATQRVEQLLSTAYADPDLNAGTHNDPANPHLGALYVRWQVEDDLPTTGCKRVTVEVHRGLTNPLLLGRLTMVKPEAGS